MKKVDRRDALKLLGLGILAAGSAPLLGARRAEAEPRRLRGASPASTVTRTSAPARSAPSATPVDAAQAPEVLPLLAPLGVGSSLAGSRILRVTGPAHGALQVDLQAPDGHPYRVEICRHDASGPAPVTRTRHYDLFLANGGRGDKRTDRAEGLAAIGLAWALRRNEHRAGKLPVMTMRHRWARFRPTEISRADG